MGSPPVNHINVALPIPGHDYFTYRLTGIPEGPVIDRLQGTGAVP